MPYRPEPPCLKQCSAKAALQADRDTLRNVLGLSNSEAEKIVSLQAKLKTAKTNEDLAASLESEIGSAAFAHLTDRVEKLEGQQEKIVAWTKLTGGADAEVLRRAAAEQARLSAESERTAAAKFDAEKAQQAHARANQAETVRFIPDAEKEKLRRQLLQQFNSILETHDSDRGLVVNLSDVFFEPGKNTLRPAAREKLGKVSSILLAYPGVQIDVTGHTEPMGGNEYGAILSEQRSAAVREYLISSGLSSASVSAQGLGKTTPAVGRMRNRNIEILVQGDVIGTKREANAF